MKKINMIFISFLIATINIGASEINDYPIEVVAAIPVGNDAGKIGGDEDFIKWAGLRPHAFTISQNMLYVCDEYNGRIVIFNANFKFVKNIPINKGIPGAEKIYVDEKENIIGLSSAPAGLLKADPKGIKQ